MGTTDNRQHSAESVTGPQSGPPTIIGLLHRYDRMDSIGPRRIIVAIVIGCVVLVVLGVIAVWAVLDDLKGL